MAVIEADISIVSPKAVGRPVQMLVLVAMERGRFDIIDRFKKASNRQLKSSMAFTSPVMLALSIR